MSLIRLICSACVGVLCSGFVVEPRATAAFSETAQADVEVALTITVLSPTGSPLRDVRLSVNDKRLGLEQQCKTNASGQATTTLRWAPAQSPPKVWVTLTQYYDKTLDSISGDKVVLRYRTLLERFHFEPYYEVAIPPAGGAVSLSIASAETVRVAGRLPDTAPESVKAFATSHQGPAQALGRMAKAFEVRGLKRGVPALIGVKVIGEPEVKPITLTAAQTASNADLGEVNVPDWEGTNIVKVTITDSMTLEDDMPQGSDCVSFISADGARVFGYGFDRAGRVWRQRQLRSAVVLPAGKYYIAPGMMGIDIKAAAVLGVVRQGENAADQAGIPSVQVTDGGQNQFIVSGPALKSAASGLPAYP